MKTIENNWEGFSEDIDSEEDVYGCGKSQGTFSPCEDCGCLPRGSKKCLQLQKEEGYFVVIKRIREEIEYVDAEVEGK